MSGPLTTLTGTLNSITGAPDAGTVTITLVNFGGYVPLISGDVVLSEIVNTVTAATDGTWSVDLWSNSQIEPGNTFYQISICPTGSNAPTQVGGYLLEAGTWDLSTLYPVIAEGAGSPYGSISWLNITGIPEVVQNLSAELALLAPLASPAFTGTPSVSGEVTIVAPDAGAVALSIWGAPLNFHGYPNLQDWYNNAGTLVAFMSGSGTLTVAGLGVIGNTVLQNTQFTGSFEDSIGSTGTNGQVLTTTGSLVLWGADGSVAIETARAEAAEALLAPKASPVFTGSPTAPTQISTDNSTKLATTAWVTTAILGSGGGTVNSVFGRFGTVVATSGDYAVAQVTGAAPIASPAFTGTPTAPTPTTGDSSTKLATTAFVAASLGGGGVVNSVFGRTGVVVATSGDYAVGQVTGAAPLANPAFTGTFKSQQLNGIIIADNLTGGDWGAKVQAADTLLGASAGEIWVSQAAGTSAPAADVTLNSGHVLRFTSGGIWNLGTKRILIPVGADNVAIVCSCPMAATLQYTGTDFAIVVGYGTTGTLTLNTLIEGIFVACQSTSNGAGCIHALCTLFLEISRCELAANTLYQQYGILSDGTGNFSSYLMVRQSTINLCYYGIKFTGPGAIGSNSNQMIGGSITGGGGTGAWVGSIGINIDSGDSCNVMGTDVEAYDTGIRINSLRNLLSAVRCESINTAILFTVSAASNTVDTIHTSGTITVSNLGAATNNVYYTDVTLAPLASPAFTGTPTAPTQTAGNNTTRLATTAFVTTAVGAVTVPVTSVFGRTGAVVATSGDYAVAQVTGAAPLASPTFTGTVTASTISGAGLTVTATSSTLSLMTTSGNMFLTPGGGGVLILNSMLTFGTDNTYAIGAAVSARPSNIYAGTKMTAPALNANNLTLTQLSTPVNAAFATATTGGTLAPATYYYRVAAADSVGTTLASTETNQVVPAGTSTNTVTVNWSAVSGATGYKVYGRTTGAELLMATVGAAVLTWVDTGSVTPSGALPVANTTGCSINCAGGVSQSYVSKSGSYTLTTNDYAVQFTATATATLPGSMPTGKIFRVKNTSATGIVTVTPTSGLIDGQASMPLADQYQSADLIFDGTNWGIF